MYTCIKQSLAWVNYLSCAAGRLRSADNRQRQLNYPQMQHRCTPRFRFGTAVFLAVCLFYLVHMCFHSRQSIKIWIKSNYIDDAAQGLNCSSISEVISRSGVKFHQYVDGAQIFRASKFEQRQPF